MKNTPTLSPLVQALDSEMRISEFQDLSHNGLQVACAEKPIRRICCGVDASLEFFAKGKAAGADLLICHHGLSWGDSLKRITGLNYRQIKFLIENDIGLWACHLPLDAHPELGNNAGIAKALSLENIKPFGKYSGVDIGFRGELAQPMSREVFSELLGKEIATPHRFDFGKETIRSVGVISGGAADEVVQAAELDLDAYISGEPTLLAYNLAQQLRINAYFCGHYATERFGPQALGRWVEAKFDVSATFIDLDLPY